MQTVYLSLLISGLMPILCAAIAKWGFKDFDNSDPRTWLSKQTGYRARANAAQANCFEAFPFFAFSVFCALSANVDIQKLSASCTVFVVARALYILFYVANKPTPRTVAWCTALASGVFNFVAAIFTMA
jgi:uncharacterized MAPEG superfamily protein